ncbi:MAG: hypothetical protein Q4D62_16055 [Planctomycetia bacterium]|nr:hypothetical protein [Planctomycetia bacterium]
MEGEKKEAADWLEKAAEVAADGVQSVSSGGRSVAKIALRDLAELAKETKKEAMAKNPLGAIVTARILPGDVRY